MGAIFTLIGLVVMGRAAWFRQRLEVSMAALTLLLLCAIVGLQYCIVGRPLFFGEAFIGMLYFSGAALAVVVGSTWEKNESGATTRMIFISLAIASVATMAIMLAQWLQLRLPSIWFTPIDPGDRVVGNLNQPNNGATLLAWGLVAFFWCASTERISRSVWIFASVPLLWCIVLTGSRINYISVLTLLVAGCFVAWREQAFRNYRMPLATLLSVFLASIFLHSIFGQHLVDADPFQREMGGARLAAYRGLSSAALEHAWWGYGFGQTVDAQLRAHGMGFQLPSLFSWSHNIFLDIALWFGLPIAILAIGVVLALTIRCARSALTVDQLALSLALLVFGLHAMVELPHAYAIFLLPACFMLGALFARRDVVFVLPGWTGVGATILLSVGLAVTLSDYLKVEKAFFDWRFKVQRVGTYHPMSVPDVLVLEQFRALIRGLRSTDEPLDAEELEMFRRAVWYFPSPYALQHLAQLQVKADKLNDAETTVRLANAILPRADRANMSKHWFYLREHDKELRVLEWPSHWPGAE